MRVRIPKEFAQMSRKERQKVADYAAEKAYEAAKIQTDKDARIILDLYLKMVCCVLHDAFGFGEKRLNYFLANHKRLFIRQSKLVQRGVQLQYLDGRMAEIFRKDGYPRQYIDGLLGEVGIEDGGGVGG